MGTTLTGTTPQDTYDSLIKVTDNGPLSGTAKYLSDGLGNDSKLALATSGVGIGTTSPPTIFGVEDTNANVAVVNVVGTSPNYIFDVRDDGTSVFRVAGTGNVGIGTSSPTAGYKLDLRGRAITYNSGYLADFVSTESNASAIQLYADNTNVSIVQGGTSAVPLTFFVGGTEKMRIQTGGGISFNGDTAAANALDDYEEGTWTMGVAFDGASVGVTTSTNTGTYTKIGRQVTVNGYLQLTSKGSSTGNATITGLPFTIANSNSNYSAVSLWFVSITYDNQFFAIGTINTTTISLQESTILGVNTPITDADFANNSGIVVSFTYFV